MPLRAHYKQTAQPRAFDDPSETHPAVTLLHSVEGGTPASNKLSLT